VTAAVAIAFLAALLQAALSLASPRLAPQDAAGVRRAVDAYRDAWLKNDASAVMATLTRDAVLMPAHARAPVVGGDAIRRFWWPDGGPPTAVTAFDTPIEEIGGSGAVAFARGRFALSFRVGAPDAAVRSISGAFLMILERQADGRWLIARRMWDDRIP